MAYVCADRGTQRCPCHLMEAGQCYTCTMIREGICSCEDAAGWQGSCPYVEYMQQGGRVLESPMDCISQFDILNKTCYADGLYVVRLRVTQGFAEACQPPGSYLMAEALGWRTPVSVLRTGSTDGRWGIAEFLVKETGPKTMALTAEDCTVWYAAGPYGNGILHLDALKDAERMVIIARGTAAAPLIHLIHSPEVSVELKENCRIFLDDAALPEDFLEEYLQGWPYERISLADGSVQERTRNLVTSALHRERKTAVVLLVSQYYVQKLTEGLTEIERNRILIPNPANLCCGMGICGACSHTDRDGITVRLCKCSQSVVK